MSGSPPIVCNQVIDALVVDSDTLTLTFAQDALAGDFGDADVFDSSTGGTSGAVSQNATNSLNFTSWNAGIGNGETWVLTTAAPGVCSPQTGTMHT